MAYPYKWESTHHDEWSCLDEGNVVVRCGQDSAVSVTFCGRWVEEYLGLYFAVHTAARGVDAVLYDVPTWADRIGLAQFIEGLDYRGWEGDLHWASRHGGLGVSARYESRGQVRLTWTLSSYEVEEIWSVTVRTWVEAGAAKDDLAARLHVFLSGPG
ncbi:DUF6228 family protein [Actinokineospora cianjurensis]|uniref:Uncharacterized protein n=1 Tax=Actinokineospora cianjurensis TaxID=585224 RepID=A0A421B400_9PSEU|nr:DUF6228 family protein [Actinokineospora cianjurensis]RLK59008.1 hypothetical protein CLV68_3490 [Actinokineospora cianjurensis]